MLKFKRFCAAMDKAQRLFSMQYKEHALHTAGTETVSVGSS